MFIPILVGLLVHTAVQADKGFIPPGPGSYFLEFPNGDDEATLVERFLKLKLGPGKVIGYLSGGAFDLGFLCSAEDRDRLLKDLSAQYRIDPTRKIEGGLIAVDWPSFPIPMPSPLKWKDFLNLFDARSMLRKGLDEETRWNKDKIVNSASYQVQPFLSKALQSDIYVRFSISFKGQAWRDPEIIAFEN